VQEEEPETPKKKNKKDVVQTLLDQVDSLENKEFEEVLTKEEKIVRHRILHILKYIASTPGNPDLRLIQEKNPALLRNDYDKLPFEELKNLYREFANLKSMDQLMCHI
jgi:2-oxo-4-hydroxy-4-carboxy--5-ureidoimidazoline (OHCU) decarboxylase